MTPLHHVNSQVLWSHAADNTINDGYTLIDSKCNQHIAFQKIISDDKKLFRHILHKVHVNLRGEGLLDDDIDVGVSMFSFVTLICSVVHICLVYGDNSKNLLTVQSRSKRFGRKFKRFLTTNAT